MRDIVDDIIAMEDGTATEEQTILAMQQMINSGQAWKMQGSYGRAAMSMIESGVCMLGEEAHHDYWGNKVPSRHEVKAGTKGSREFVEEHNPDSPVLATERKPSKKKKTAA